MLAGLTGSLEHEIIYGQGLSHLSVRGISLAVTLEKKNFAHNGFYLSVLK